MNRTLNIGLIILSDRKGKKLVELSASELDMSKLFHVFYVSESCTVFKNLEHYCVKVGQIFNEKHTSIT